MDADAMITVVFCLEVFLFALAAGVFVAREARKARAKAAAEDGRERVESTKMHTRPRPSASAKVAAHAVPLVTARVRRAVRAVRS
jgi:hypothetical protein